MIKFSIIIPTKNEQNYLPRCLESLNCLDFQPDAYEVLVIDNGSTDRTVAIAKDFGAQVFVCPELTIAGLRNFGASNAKGQILAFLDADCTVALDWLRAASRWYDQKDICCFGSPPEAPENATWVQKAWSLIRYKRQIVEDVQWLESMNMFVRKEIFDLVHGFNEMLITCEDYDLSLRLQGHGRIVADSRIRAVHYGEAATLNHFYQKERWRGQSNFTGMFRHGLYWRELPSLLIPLIHIFFMVVMGSILLMMLGSGMQHGFWFLTTVLLVWQLPILCIALWKSRTVDDHHLRIGLYLLLNLYFFARGASILCGGRR